MKNFAKAAVAVILVAVLVFAFASCTTKLNGTYAPKEEGIVDYTFTFSDENNVSFNAFGFNANGTYSIEDGKITITYMVLNISKDIVKDFEKDGSSIFIDGVEYVKQK